MEHTMYSDGTHETSFLRISELTNSPNLVRQWDKFRNGGNVHDAYQLDDVDQRIVEIIRSISGDTARFDQWMNAAIIHKYQLQLARNVFIRVTEDGRIEQMIDSYSNDEKENIRSFVTSVTSVDPNETHNLFSVFIFHASQNTVRFCIDNGVGSVFANPGYPEEAEHIFN